MVSILDVCRGPDRVLVSFKDKISKYYFWQNKLAKIGTFIWPVLVYFFFKGLHIGESKLGFSNNGEAHSEPSQTSNKELFAKTDHGWRTLIILTKSSYFKDASLGAEYTSATDIKIALLQADMGQSIQEWTK